MKVMERSIARIFPGKMAEAMKLLEEQMAIAKRYGMPPWRTYRPMIGGGDSRHTIVFEIEWDSLTAMVTFYEKAMADPEVQKQDREWEAVGESHEVELYMVMP
jgi:hypothetical protein